MLALLCGPIAAGIVGAGPPAHKHNLLSHSHKCHPSTPKKCLHHLCADLLADVEVSLHTAACAWASITSTIRRSWVWATLIRSSPKATFTPQLLWPGCHPHPPWADVNSPLKTRTGNNWIHSQLSGSKNELTATQKETKLQIVLEMTRNLLQYK